MSIRIIVKNILLLSLISLIIRSFGKITINFSNYIYNPALYTQTTIMYLLFYLILFIGLSPYRYLNISKILYQLIRLAKRYLNDKDNIILYVTIFDSVILVLLGATIRKTSKN